MSIVSKSLVRQTHVITHHLHCRQDGNWITLLDISAILDTDFNDHTAHWCSDLAAVARVGLWSTSVLHCSVLVLNSDLSHLAVDLEEDLTLTSLVAEWSNRQELQNEHLALLELNVEFLANLWLVEEVSCRQD